MMSIGFHWAVYPSPCPIVEFRPQHREEAARLKYQSAIPESQLQHPEEVGILEFQSATPELLRLHLAVGGQPVFL